MAIYVRQSFERLQRFREFHLVIPEFQRGRVWTTNQQAVYLSRLMRGIPAGTFLLWERDYRGPLLLIDGQQRSVAMGIPSLGSPVPMWLDFVAWQDGAPVFWTDSRPTNFVHAYSVHDVGESTTKTLERLGDRSAGGALNPEDTILVRAIETLRDVTIHTITLPHEADDQFVRETFEAINQGGTPWTDLGSSRAGEK